MSTLTTKIIFPAVLNVDQFETQVVRLGGIFPEIEIELVDSATGLHHFKIAKVLPDFGLRMIASAVAESELQIDMFWNILSYVRDTTIHTTGQVLYEVNGRAQEFNPTPRPSMIIGVGIASKTWFDDKAPLFHKVYDLDLLKRFNFSRAIEEPIGKFISLYSLLASRCNDKQDNIDKLIENVEPNVSKSISPIREGKTETIFTRLRNELAHYRNGISVIETHKNIEVHLPRFEWIVKVIVQKYIEI